MPDRYINQKVLADSGASRLIRAKDRETGQIVILRTYQTSTADERQALEALLAVLAELRHPHIEPVHEVIRDRDELAIRTELLEGETISQIVAAGPLSLGEFKALAMQVLEALAAAHERGIVHGSLNAERLLCSRKPNEPLSACLTGYGVGFGGKPGSDDFSPYLCVPPEQWEQQPAHRRSDVYSLGCVFYQALSGKSPFMGKTLKEVRHKHLHHDVLALEKVAPQAPRWLCDWVMSLITADPDKRAKSGQVALDEFRKAEAAGNFPPTESSAAVAGKPTPTTGYAPIVQPALVVPNPPATHAVALPPKSARASAAPKPPTSPRRPHPGKAQVATSRSTHVPDTPSDRWFENKWIGIGGVAAVAIGLGLMLTLNRGKKEIIKVAANPAKASSAANPKLISPPSGNDLPPVQGGYPPSRQKPPNYEQVVFHVMCDAGALSIRADAAGKPQPASLNDPVFAWKDFAERGRDSTLYHPGQGNAFPQFISRKPDATFPLAKERRFIRFKGEGSPPAALSLNPKNQARDFPFGHANPLLARGLTFAVILYQEIKGYQQTMLHLSSQYGSAALRLGEWGDLRFSPRVGGIPENQQTPTLSIAADKFNPIEPLLVVGVWRSDPAEAQLRVRSASGWASETALVATQTPRDSLSNLLIGREPLPGPTSANKSTDPKSLRAFCGGIAEILLYSTGLKDTDLAALEKQLTAHYFPPQK